MNDNKKQNTSSGINFADIVLSIEKVDEKKKTTTVTEQTPVKAENKTKNTAATNENTMTPAVKEIMEQAQEKEKKQQETIKKENTAAPAPTKEETPSAVKVQEPTKAENKTKKGVAATQVTTPKEEQKKPEEKLHEPIKKENEKTVTEKPVIPENEKKEDKKEIVTNSDDHNEIKTENNNKSNKLAFLKKPYVWIIALVVIAAIVVACLFINKDGANPTNDNPAADLPEVSFCENWTPTDETYKKYEYIITAENNGDKEYYVRIDLETGIEDEEDEAKWINEHLNDAWTESGDYFYYEKPLAPGESSKPLLNKAYTNETFLIEDYEATVYLGDTGFEKANGYDNAKDAFSGKK